MKDKGDKENTKKPLDKNRLSNFKVGQAPEVVKLSYETAHGSSYQPYSELKASDIDQR